MNTSPECHKLDTPAQVFFYEQDFYVLSNFSAFALLWPFDRDPEDAMRFGTAEAAYHWEKFPKQHHLQMLILRAPSAHEAFKIAQTHKALQRPDWDEVKVDIMRNILREKAQQHEYVRRKLLDTGDRELVEDSWRDDFWGWGENRNGKNMLGKLWMEIRAELRGKTYEGGAGLPRHSTDDAATGTAPPDAPGRESGPSPDTKFLPCPFCGARPHSGPTKARPDQLHGDALQNFAIWCPHGHAKIERTSRQIAATEWNKRPGAHPSDEPCPPTAPPIVFWYRNYDGKEGYRRARPISIRHGTSEWHRMPQWLLLAFDIDKNAEREYAMSDMRQVVDAPTFGIAVTTPSGAMTWEQIARYNSDVLHAADEEIARLRALNAKPEAATGES